MTSSLFSPNGTMINKSHRRPLFVLELKIEVREREIRVVAA